MDTGFRRYDTGATAHPVVASTYLMPRSSMARWLCPAAAWVKTLAGALVLLIIGTFALRLLLAAALGLGIDESYMVAAGRKWQLSYFDHPPIAWWLAWGIGPSCRQ